MEHRGMMALDRHCMMQVHDRSDKGYSNLTLAITFPVAFSSAQLPVWPNRWRSYIFIVEPILRRKNRLAVRPVLSRSSPRCGVSLGAPSDPVVAVVVTVLVCFAATRTLGLAPYESGFALDRLPSRPVCMGQCSASAL
uniref:Uncharacterized protein n=1 Tax=Anopheles melas TaxID=34690 RepID=A0A182U9J2_9DIPT